MSELETLQSTATSLIVSDERFSQQLGDVYKIGPAVLDWVAIKETISWNVIVAASYRVYHEWLLEAKAAAEQVHLQQHSAALPRLARWPAKEHGMLLEPMFPHFVNDAVHKLDVPDTRRILKLYTPYVSEVKILNLQVPNQSPTTTFLCDLIRAATSCEKSKQQDKESLFQAADRHGLVRFSTLR